MPQAITALLILLKVLLPLAAFIGMGRLLCRCIPPLRRCRLPAFPTGMVFYLLLSFVLSLLNTLTPPVLVVFMAIGALIAVLSIDNLPAWTKTGWGTVSVALGALALFLTATNLARAARPNQHSDPLITYAVQPDRWLDEGSIHFLEETKFSLAPMVGETLALWPTALGDSRLERLSLLQVFQMSMLLASLLYVGTRASKLTGPVTVFAIVSAGMAASKLAGWGALAKVDMTMLFFVTAALTEGYRGRNNSSMVMAFLLMGLAAGTKHTAWLVVPTFLLYSRKHLAKLTKRQWGLSIALFLLIPLGYMVRTYAHSGSLIFAAGRSFPPAEGFWRAVSVPSLAILEDYPSAGILANLRDLFLGWSIPALLFLLGILERTRVAGPKRSLRLWAPIVPYVLLCLWAFDPLRWGSKYTIMIMPFLAGIGAFSIAGSRYSHTYHGFLIVVILLTSSIVPRARFLYDFLGSSHALDFPPTDYYASPRMLHERSNGLLEDRSVILSLFSGERYFSDYPVICARTYPYARRMFKASTLEEELEIAEELGVTHVCFNPDDPMEMALHDRNYWNPPPERPDPAEDLRITDSIGDRPGLERVVTVGRFTLYSVSYD